MAELTTDARISALEREVAELKQKLTQIVAERRPLDELRSDIRNVARTVAEFSEREQAHEDYVQTRFAAVEADLESMDSDIKALQAGQSELRADMRALREDMQELRQSVHALQIGHLALAAEQREMRIAMQELAVGQRQILEILLGRPRQND